MSRRVCIFSFLQYIIHNAFYCMGSPFATKKLDRLLVTPCRDKAITNMVWPICCAKSRYMWTISWSILRAVKNVIDPFIGPYAVQRVHIFLDFLDDALLPGVDIIDVFCDPYAVHRIGTIDPLVGLYAVHRVETIDPRIGQMAFRSRHNWPFYWSWTVQGNT